MCVGEDAIDPMGTSETWPDGVRDVLTQLGSQADLAEQPDDRTTWFDGASAFPV